VRWEPINSYTLLYLFYLLPETNVHRIKQEVPQQYFGRHLSSNCLWPLLSAMLMGAGHSDLLLVFLSVFFSAPNLRGRTVDRHHILTDV